MANFTFLKHKQFHKPVWRHLFSPKSVMKEMIRKMYLLCVCVFVSLVSCASFHCFKARQVFGEDKLL